jgi:hypothetical protein
MIVARITAAMKLRPLVKARRHGSEALKPVDGTLDDLAPFVGLGIEAWRRSSLAAFA